MQHSDTTSPAITIPHSSRDEILTVPELASLLKMSRRQVYELTRSRGQIKQEHPVPILRINGNIRFSRRAVEAWLERIGGSGRVQ